MMVADQGPMAFVAAAGQPAVPVVVHSGARTVVQLELQPDTGADTVVQHFAALEIVSGIVGAQWVGGPDGCMDVPLVPLLGHVLVLNPVCIDVVLWHMGIEVGPQLVALAGDGHGHVRGLFPSLSCH